MVNGILESFLEDLTIDEMESAYESVLDTAMEGHIISKEQRDNLPESSFGVKEGRKYPLIVPGDKKKTKELISTAISMFHYCKGEYRNELAKNIIAAMDKTNTVIKIHPKSTINKYIDVPDKYVAVDTHDETHVERTKERLANKAKRES